MLSVTLTSFSLNIKDQEEKEDVKEYSFLASDEYSQNYDENYFKDNALKINAINNLIKENNKQLATQDLAKEKDLDTSRLLTSTSKIGFVLPTFTMAAYKDYAFYFFYKKYPNVNENEFVTSDLGSLSPILRNSEDSFITRNQLDYNI